MNNNKFLNIQSLDSSKTSIAKVLLIFYLIVASNYTDNLMSKQLKKYISENRLVQHIIGFMTMIVLITIVGGIVDTRSALVYSLISYIWFVFSTKLDIHWNIVILTLLLFGYLYENNLIVREKEILSDPSLTDKQKIEIISNFNRFKTWIVSTIILITVIGTLAYSNRKRVQYGGSYNAFTYFLY